MAPTTVETNGRKAIAAVSPAGDELNHLVAAQLCKTKMCAMFQRGACHDPQCRFAHNFDELRTAPDLTKTAICRMFARGQCRNSDCKFAHGEQELRVTPSVYKTQLCNFHSRGHCKKGKRCRHAHGDEELRSFQAQAAAQAKPQPESEPETEPRSPYYQGLTPPSRSGTGFGGASGRLTPEKMSAKAKHASCDEVGALLAGVLDEALLPRDAVPPLPTLRSVTPAPDDTQPMKVALTTDAQCILGSPPRQPSALSEVPSAPRWPQMAPSAEQLPGSPLARSPLFPGLVTHGGDDLQALCLGYNDTATRAAEIVKRAEIDLLAAQIKAHQQMNMAAQFAAMAAAAGQDSHFDSIMNTLRPQQAAPRNVQSTYAAPPMQPPPGLDQTNSWGGGHDGGSSPASPQSLARDLQSWHPVDVNQEQSTAWVI